MQQHWILGLCVRIVLTTLIAGTAWSSGSAQQSDAATGASWLAWKAFHASVNFYAQKSPDLAQDILQQQFRLTPAEAAGVLAAGQAYTSELERIDADARREAEHRYPDLMSSRRGASTGRQRWTAPKGMTGSKEMTAPQSLRERAVKDGLFAQVERRKAAALARHKAALGAVLEPATLAQIDGWLETSVRAKTWTRAAARPRGGPSRLPQTTPQPRPEQ